MPSSAGPGSRRLISVPPWRIAKSAPLEVTCTCRPEAEEILVAANRDDVLSRPVAARRAFVGRGIAAVSALALASGTADRGTWTGESTVHRAAG